MSLVEGFEGCGIAALRARYRFSLAPFDSHVRRSCVLHAYSPFVLGKFIRGFADGK
jgi:hypothetical protein